MQQADREIVELRSIMISSSRIPGKYMRTNIVAVLFCIYSALTILDWSQYMPMYPQIDSVYKIYQAILVMLLFIVFLLSFPTSQEYILYFSLILFSIYYTVLTKDFKFILFVSFFMTCKNIDYSKILKCDVIVKIIGFCFIYFSYRLNYISDFLVLRVNGAWRHSLGFSYPTFTMYVIMLIAMEWILIRKEKLTFIELLLILIIGIKIGSITDARGEELALIICSIGVAFIIKLKDKGNLNPFRNKIIKKISILVPEILAIISYAITVLIKYNSSTYNEINSFTSNRLEIFNFFNKLYGFHLFPIGSATSYINSGGEYIHVIDNLYLYLCFIGGAISLLIYLVLLSSIIKNSIETNRPVLTIILLSLTFLNLIEWQTLAPVIAFYVITYRNIYNSKEKL